MTTKKQRQLPVIGWQERVEFPEWGLAGVQAKIDTGARISAIDVAEIQELPDGRIRFEVVARARPKRITQWVTATPARSAKIKPSHGVVQHRHVCLTTIRIGEHEQEIELSLVCRKRMLCRMLIGRTALSGHFLVDSRRKHLLTKPATKPATTTELIEPRGDQR